MSTANVTDVVAVTPADTAVIAVSNVTTHILNDTSSSSSLFDDPSTYITAIIATAVLILVPLIYFIYEYVIKPRFETPTIVIAGPLSSGKTVLYYLLKEGKRRETQTSMQKNEDTFNIVKSQRASPEFRVVDVPGHASLRSTLRTVLPSARGIIFVVPANPQMTITTTSTTINTDDVMSSILKDAANTLFNDILTNDILLSRSTRLVIYYNETTNTKHEDAIKHNTTLQNYIDICRRTQSTMPDLQGEGGSRTKLKRLGTPNKPFEWRDSKMPVTILYGNIADEEVRGLIKWIDEL